jgi:hypothetical protein
MGDTPADSRTWRTRPRHWLIAGGLSVLLLLAAIELLVNQPLLSKARRVRIGDTEAEVKEILGPPDMWQTRPVTFTTCRSWYGPVQSWWDWNVADRIQSLVPLWSPYRYVPTFASYE